MEAARQGLRARVQGETTIAGSSTVPAHVIDRPISDFHNNISIVHGGVNKVKTQEKTRESAGSYTPGERRDRRRARSDWQRQQYRVAERELGDDEDANSHEAGDGAS